MPEVTGSEAQAQSLLGNEEDVIDPTATAEEEEVEEPVVEEYVAPSQEEFEKVKAALAKANEEAKNNRLALKEQKQTEQSADSEALKNEATTYKNLFLKTAASSALKDAGVTGSADRLFKLLDLDAIEVNTDGEVSGIEDQIDGLKADFPELFSKPAPKKKASVNAGNTGPVNQQKTPSQLQAERLLGK